MTVDSSQIKDPISTSLHLPTPSVSNNGPTFTPIVPTISSTVPLSTKSSAVPPEVLSTTSAVPPEVLSTPFEVPSSDPILFSPESSRPSPVPSHASASKVYDPVKMDLSSSSPPLGSSPTPYAIPSSSLDLRRSVNARAKPVL